LAQELVFQSGIATAGRNLTQASVLRVTWNKKNTIGRKAQTSQTWIKGINRLQDLTGLCNFKFVLLHSTHHNPNEAAEPEIDLHI
jgi:hypothetical protein